MFARLLRFLCCILFAFAAGTASAEDALLDIPTRPGVTVPVFWMPRENASATVILLPGGGGSLGKLVDGKPGSINFLVRSRDEFATHGFNVAVVGRASDKEDLTTGYRTNAEHVDDLRAVVDALRQRSNLPLWMIGTSRGTVSATAAAIAFGNERLAGIVLTSSITNMKHPGAVPAQKLEAIRIPVLVMHHERDACGGCRPYETSWIMRGLVNAPVKKLMLVNGGGDPSGDPCEPLHWHGYIGMEKQAVESIANWIRQPAS
jgi:predicted alpha/beta-hydrolase family hydrolase